MYKYHAIMLHIKYGGTKYIYINNNIILAHFHSK